MDSNQENQPSHWKLVGGPEGGSVAAVALYKGKEYSAYAATGVGIFYSKGGLDEVGKNWERLAESPANAVAISIAPDFEEDPCIVAGNLSGLYLSRDAGKSWKKGRIPRTTATIQAIAFSPNYAQDGFIFAGTREDGILYSDDRGQTWKTRSFGFLDPSVSTIAISPAFTKDETAYAGTDSGLYYTYTGGLAWRELPFPTEAGAVLCLGISPGFSQDGIVFAGTEEGGLYRSRNRGKGWQTLRSPGMMINALLVSPKFDQDNTLMVITENGVFQSKDQGDHWEMLVEVDGGVCVARSDQMILLGLIDNGILRSQNLLDWEPVQKFYAREFTCLKLSPYFNQDETALVCGIREGIWKTTDSGKTWVCLNESLPGTGIPVVLFSPNYNHKPILYAASQEGVLISHDAGENWEICYSEPVNHLAISVSGQTLLAGTAGQGAAVSRDAGVHWIPLPGPWEIEGDIQEVALGSDNHYFIASIVRETNHLEIGLGKPGQWYRVYNQPSSNELVSLYIPATYLIDNIWYASTGSKVWRIGLRRDATASGIPIKGGPLTEDEPTVLTLSGVQGLNNRTLLASTGRKLFRSDDGIEWEPELEQLKDWIIALALSPDYREDKTIFALSLGGQVWKYIKE
jgi:photosystem II stability/assembly factor-like uncharacterized protein